MVFGFGKSTEQKDGVGAPGDVVKDTSTATFAKDVLETSRNVPVLVDFWRDMVRTVQTTDAHPREGSAQLQGQGPLGKNQYR